MKVPATIIDKKQETSSIITLRLDLGGQDFKFLAGQWVDCYVEIGGRPEVAGYSMTSSPLAAGTIDLAVKRTETNAVTRFLHERAKVGDVLHIDGGQGEFFYQREMGDSLILIGGGIGITPLMSIMRYVEEAAPDVRATLAYSARYPSELLFRNQLLHMAACNENIRCLFTVSGPTNEAWDGQTGRIDAEMLTEAQTDPDALIYVCGPPPMIRNMLSLLCGLGVSASRIKYEKW